MNLVNLLLLLILRGDVETNPGPWIKYPCGIYADTQLIALPFSVTTVTLGYTTHVLDLQILVINLISNLTFICPKCQLPTFLRNMNLTFETSSNPFETLQNSDSLTDSLPDITSPDHFRPAPNATSSPKKRCVHRVTATNLRVMSVNCNSIQSQCLSQELKNVRHMSHQAEKGETCLTKLRHVSRSSNTCLTELKKGSSTSNVERTSK